MAAPSESPRAPLVEVFASIQGEGAFAGDAQSFVRFAGCPLRCKYCDSEHTWFAADRWRIAGIHGSRECNNPAGIPEILSALREVETDGIPRAVSLTGGEPLVHADFIQKLAPVLRSEGRRVHLETAAVHARELEKVILQLDHVSADLKLASTMESGEFLDSHRRFLQICADAGVDTCVKCVITPAVTDREFEAALELVASLQRDWLFVVQPATPMRSERTAVAPARLDALFSAARRRLPRARVLPQVHRALGIL